MGKLLYFKGVERPGNFFPLYRAVEADYWKKVKKREKRLIKKKKKKKKKEKDFSPHPQWQGGGGSAGHTSKLIRVNLY